MTSTNIYILRLSGGHYYVGKSVDPMQRYAEHLEGRGSAWTRKYRPIAVDRIIESVSPFEEDKITKEYMARYGIDKVRGGSYVSIELDDVQKETLQRELWAAADCCTVCGRKGHYAASCFANSDVNGAKIIESESDSEYETDSDTDSEFYWECEKCTAQFSSKLACISHERNCRVRGGAGCISCYRCGREGHYASDCYASTHRKGWYI